MVRDGLLKQNRRCIILPVNDFRAFRRVLLGSSTSWGSEVRALYRQLLKAFRSNELRNAFFVAFCKGALAKESAKRWEANWEADSSSRPPDCTVPRFSRALVPQITIEGPLEQVLTQVHTGFSWPDRPACLDVKASSSQSPLKPVTAAPRWSCQEQKLGSLG
jgi:hypothetical protein